MASEVRPGSLSVDYRESSFSKCMKKNYAVVHIALGIILAIFSGLIGCGCIPVLVSAHPMFIAGCLATGAGIIFCLGALRASTSYECAIIRRNNSPD